MTTRTIAQGRQVRVIEHAHLMLDVGSSGVTVVVASMYSPSITVPGMSSSPTATLNVSPTT
jgi:hypothetical protein